MTKAKDLLLPAMGLLPLTAGAQAQATDSNGEQTAKRPNIIYIMCDDMGYADLGCYGQKRIDTPNLDRMAEQGMRFTQAYAGSPVSAPSRASFMTGQHTGHVHVRGNREYWGSAFRNNVFGNNGDYTIIGQEPYLMTHPIIPELMKEAGYATGMFGKWAGGYYNMDYPDTYILDANGNTDTSKSGQSSSASLPNKRGIDCYYGYICQFQAHTYYPNFLNRYDPEKYGDKHVVVDTLKQNIQHKAVYTGDKDYENREQYTSDLIHQYALDWIDRRAEDPDTPFFGIFTYTLPHAELWQPQDSLVEKYTKRFEGQDGSFGGTFGSWYYLNYGRHAQFAAMVERLDIQVGEIFAKLEEEGLADNTLVIFTSDNGPHQEGGADPAWFNQEALLQGTKRSTHEGGIRVPFIAKGPGVPAGTVNDHQLAFYDLMPTLLDYAGLDGSQYSLANSGEEGSYDGISFKETLTGNDEAQEEHEFLYWEFHETNMMALRKGDWKLVVQGGSPRLYDLATDLHEDTDVAAQHPDIVKEMIEIIHRQHTESSMFGVTLPAIPEEVPTPQLTFNRDDQTVSINSDFSGVTAEFVSMTINGEEGAFKSSTGTYLTNEVLCPNVNANTSPTIKMTFKLKGLTSLKTIGLTVLGLNSGGNYQNQGGPERTWKIICAVGSTEETTTDIATFTQNVTVEQGGGDAKFELSKELEEAVTISPDGAYLTLTISNVTSDGCFFGLSAISLDGSTIYTPEYTGERTSNDRKINTLALPSTLGGNSITLTHTGNGLQYIDRTKTDTMCVYAGESVTPAIALHSGGWIHAYTYVDIAGNGFTAGLADNGYTPTEDLMTYSCYSADEITWYNSAGTVSNNNTLVMPAFTAPTTPGIYRMRFKTDWNNIMPDGSADANNEQDQFASAWGTIVDVTLMVEGEQQPDSDASILEDAVTANNAINIYGLQRYFGLVQSGDGYYCNYPASTSQESGNAYTNMLDNNYDTFFHSGYDGTRGDGTAHYLQATLTKAVKSFRFYFKKRKQNNNNRPIEVLIQGSTDGITFSDITTINTGMPTDAAVLDYYSDAITSTTAYKYLRFTVKKTSSDKNSTNPFYTFSEFYILPNYAKVSETFDAVRNYRTADVKTKEIAEAINGAYTWNAGLTNGTPIVGADHFVYADTKQNDGTYIARYLYNNGGTLATSTSLDANNDMYAWTATLSDSYYTFQNVGDKAKYLGYGNSGSGLTVNTTPVQLDIQSSHAVHTGSVGIKRIGTDSNGKFMVTAADGSSFNRNSSAVNNGSWCSDYMFVPADIYDGMNTFTIVANTAQANAVFVWDVHEITSGESALFSTADVITDGTLKLKSCSPTHILEGFYSDNGYTNKITEVSELTENTTVYAKFILNIFSEKYGDKWVRLSNCSNANYWATVESTAANGNGKTATLDYADEKQLWCLVGNASNFVLYNKAAGESLALNVPLSGTNTAVISGDQASLSATKGTWKFIEQDFGYALVPTADNNSNLGINMWAGAGGNLKVYNTGAGNTGSYWTVQLADVANPLTLNVAVDKVWESSPRVAELTVSLDGKTSTTRILGSVAGQKMYLPVGATFSLSSMTYRGYTFNGFGGEYTDATIPQGGLEITASYTANDERTLFYSPKDGHPYRIPAIATAPNGDIFAICDYRPCGNDIGYGEVDLVCRISSDNGVTWTEERKIADGKGDDYAANDTSLIWKVGYGDPAIVADRESNKILVMSVCGNQTCWDGTFGEANPNPNRVARLYIEHDGEKWVYGEPEEVTYNIYPKFVDKEGNVHAASLFIGAGKICQSRVVKKDKYYRLYCAVWNVTKTQRQHHNYVIYSDDFGQTWNVLGDLGYENSASKWGNEPKVEELPDGTVVLSSRKYNGRYFNLFTFDDDTYTTGSWLGEVGSNEVENGLSFGGNSTNGEIYKVKAIRKSDGQICDVMLQSIPTGNDRSNVAVYYKEMEYTEAYTPTTFAQGWTLGKQVSQKASCYSTMILQADGRIGFFFEEVPGGYCMIYIPYTVEDLTDDKYSLYTVTSTITDVKVGTFYASEAVQIPEGVKAYVADENNLADGVITMTQLEDGIIPAHTGAVLRGEADSYEFIPSISYGTPVEGNLLVGHEAANSKDTEENRLSVLISENPSASIYVLANDSEGAKFYKKSADFTVKNNKAYLRIPNATLAQALRIRFGNEENGEGGTTSIDEGQLTIDNGQLTIYDLQGRRVLNPTKGMYIVGGKKIVIK